MSTTERKARERLQRERVLLDSAIALLDRDDWQSVTVEEIAERAEYAKGTVYRHFASKDDLYARLAADWNAGTHAALEALDAERPFEAVLRDVVAVCWRRMTGDRVHARLLQHVQRADFLAGVTPETRAALDETDARTLGLVAGLDETDARTLGLVAGLDETDARTLGLVAGLDETDARTLGLVAGLIDWGIAEGAIPKAPLEPRLFAVTALLMGALRLHPLWGGRDGADPERVVADATLAILRG